MAKAPNKNPMGNYTFSPYETECYRWCVGNNILISPTAASSEKDNGKWYINIEVNKQTKISPVTYKPTHIWIKIAEMYVFFFEKNNKNKTKQTIFVKEKEKPKEKLSQNQLNF